MARRTLHLRTQTELHEVIRFFCLDLGCQHARGEFFYQQVSLHTHALITRHAAPHVLSAQGGGMRCSFLCIARARLHILVGILRIPVFSVPVALFQQEETRSELVLGKRG